MNKGIFHTTIQPGESMFDAICRAGAAANQGGFAGYSIDCSKCGQPLSDSHTPEECEIYLREFGKAGTQ
jgi:hypothetical protein